MNQPVTKPTTHFCSWCQQAYKVGDGPWIKTPKDDYANRETTCKDAGDPLTHGICPDCYPAFKLKCQEAARQHAAKLNMTAQDGPKPDETPPKT